MIMKTTLLFLSVFLSVSLFGQITVSELIKIAQMDRESFELYALNNGYEFHKAGETENQSKIIMVKGQKPKEVYLYHADRYFSKRYHSLYDTYNKKDLGLWYFQLEELGFILTNKEFVGSTYAKDYTRGKETISIYQKKENLEIAYSMDK